MSFEEGKIHDKCQVNALHNTLKNLVISNQVNFCFVYGILYYLDIY